MIPQRKNVLNYDQIGNVSSEENLVFVHGSGCNRKFLRALADKLRDFNCYLIDLPCHGNSYKGECTKVEDYVEAVADFVSELTNVTIIGHSLGGTICLGVAAKSLPSVKRSVVISSGAKFYKMESEIHEMVQKQKVNWLYLLRSLGSFDDLESVKDFFRFESADIVLKDFEIDLKLDLEPELKNIKTPTLIIAGEDDFLVVPEYSVKMRKMIKRSKLIIFPKVRHMLPIAKRNQVSRLIRTFVNRVQIVSLSLRNDKQDELVSQFNFREYNKRAVIEFLSE